MKFKSFSVITILLLFSLYVSAHEINVLSCFTILGEFELRSVPDFSEPPQDITLNHEGGMKVCVIEMGKKETHDDKPGVWLKIITTASMWCASGEWIEKNTRFWIFLEDETKLFDYEE